MVKLNLEQRTVGALLRDASPYFSKFDKNNSDFLDKLEEDLAIIRKKENNEISYEHQEILEVKSRNPFLDMNYFYQAKGLVERAIDKKYNYDIKSALLSVISDPFNTGGEGIFRSSGAQEMAHNPYTLMFYHEMGVSLGIEREVDEKINEYLTKAIKDSKTKLRKLANSPEMSATAQQIKDRLSAFDKCTDSNFIACSENRTPLMDGDKKVIDILTALTTKNLEIYAKTYCKSE